MFITKRPSPNSPRKTVQIIENYRVGKKVRQKILAYIGVIASPDEEEKMMALAKVKLLQLIKERSLELGKELSDEEALSLTKRGRKNPALLPKPAVDKETSVNLSSLVEERRVVDGIDDIAGSIFDNLGFGKILHAENQNQTLRDVVLSRMVYSQSKLKLCDTMAKKLNRHHTEDQVYRVMDKLYPKIDQVKKIIFDRTKSLAPRVNVLLFDVTTLYCESVVQDELRDFGFSKDCKINNTQIVLALATNELGLPIGYELFPGNFAEVNTLFFAINKWSKLFNIDDVCFVGDRAMFSENNIKLIEEHGYKYIIAAKLRSLPEAMQQSITDEKNYKEMKFGDEVGRIMEIKYAREENVRCAFDNEDFGYKIITKQNEIVGVKYLSPNSNELFATQENFNLVKDQIKKIKSYTLQCECILMTKEEYDLVAKPDESFKNKAIIFGDNISYNGVIKNFDKLTKTEKTQLLTTANKGKITNSTMTKLFENYSPKKYINIPDEIISTLFTKKGTNKIQRLCVSYKPSRATNDLKKRERILSRLEPKQGHTNQIIKTSAKMYMTTNGTSILDSEKITKAEKWDGIHGVVTNIMTDKAEDIIARYNNLWKIEDAFRINKHNLNMRPLYHYKKERIYSHIAICYMGFAILKLIQYQTQLTQPRFTINNILETLLSVESSIYVDADKKIRYKIPGVMTNDATALYQAFGVKKTRKAITII